MKKWCCVSPIGAAGAAYAAKQAAAGRPVGSYVEAMKQKKAAAQEQRWQAEQRRHSERQERDRRYLEEEEARQRKRLAVEHRPLAPSLRYTIIAALWAIVSLARSLSVLDASLQLAASVCGSRCQTLQHTLMRCSPCVVLALGRLQPWWKESDAVHACGARHRVRVPSPTRSFNGIIGSSSSAPQYNTLTDLQLHLYI